MAFPFEPIKSGKVESLSARARKRLRATWVFRKLAKYQVFHTNAQPTLPPQLKLKTRPRPVRKQAWQIRKRSRSGFNIFHFQPPYPPPVGITGGFIRTFSTIRVRFAAHVRNTRAEIKRKPAFNFRKRVNFAQWHTGATPGAPTSVFVAHMRTSPRKVRKQASYQIRKLATYPSSQTGQTSPLRVPFQSRRQRVVKHSFARKKQAKYMLFELGVGGPTGQALPTFVVQNFGFKSRHQSQFRRRAIIKKMARFDRVWNTGTQTVAQTQTYKFFTRRRKVTRTSSYRQRKTNHYLLFPTGSTAAVSRLTATVTSRKRRVLKVKHNRAFFTLFHFTAPIIPAITNYADPEIHIFKISFDNKMHKL